MTLTPEQRAELDALYGRMTDGKWIAAPYSSVVGAPIVASPSGRSVAKVTYFALGPKFANHDNESAANGAGIVALKNTWPVASAHMAAQDERIAAQAAEIARLREALAEYASNTSWHWNGSAWEWNAGGSASFMGSQVKPTEYPKQEDVDRECGKVARAALKETDHGGC